MKTRDIAAMIGALLLAPAARAGTVTVQGDQTVAGSQLVQSNQVVAGTLTSQGASAEVAATRFRAFGPTASDRWIRVARIGGTDLTNAVVSGRVLAQGSAPGQQYVADFAFPGPGQNPYSPVLVEMGGASSFIWAVYGSGSDHWLWFRQSSGSGFANFLYGEAACTSLWETNGSPSGTLVWASTQSAAPRQSLKAGGLKLTSGLTLPDGTLISARSNMTATALVDPSSGQRLMEVSGGRLRFTGASDFLGAVSLPDSIGLGTNGQSITAAQWAAVESSLVGGRGAKQIGATAGWVIAGMAEGGSGDRYAYGHFAGTMHAAGEVLASGASEADRAAFVLKIDPVGRIAWARAFPVVNHSANGQQNENLVQIARAVADGSGNVILAGTFRAEADFAGLTNAPSGDPAGFAVSLRPDGTAAWFRPLDAGVAALAVDPGGTNLVVGFASEAWLLAAADGSYLGPQFSWGTLGPVARACFSGASPVVACEGGAVMKLGPGTWEWVNYYGGTVTDLLGTPSGDVLVFDGGREDGGATVGGATMLASGDGYELWSETGYSWGTGWSQEVYDGYDEYGNPIWVGTQTWGSSASHCLRDAAVDRAGNVWLAWEGGDSSSASGPLENYSYSNSYHNVGRRGGDFVDLGHPFSMCADAAGDIHAMGQVDGGLRDVRFDGQTGAQEADSRVMGAAGDLLAASQTAQSLVVAGSGGIGQFSDWDISVSVDGVVSAGSGILLGDGTVLGSASDIAALGPVQSGAGGTYFVMGSVGIGTDAPAYGLDVAGTARVTGPLTLGGALTVGGALSAAGASVSGDLAVAGNLTVTNNLAVLGTADLARVPARGDVPMGAFTNGPAQ